MKIYTCTHKTQYYETDQMGVVHHSNYIRWFEEGRVFFLEEIGYPYQRLEKELKLISPVLESHCQYRSMVYFGDTVDISLRVESSNGIKLKFSYEIRDHETRELRANGYTKHCFLDSAGTLVSLKKAQPELYKILKECTEE
ncbi:MAG: acyl-CoA thioesterase [Eubacteriales bacterium]|nr:acyl-CoA thioesterase [Eubacteriales bacterium]